MTIPKRNHTVRTSLVTAETISGSNQPQPIPSAVMAAAGLSDGKNQSDRQMFNGGALFPNSQNFPDGRTAAPVSGFIQHGTP